MTELETIRAFAEQDDLITEHIPEMEQNLQHAIGFHQRIGTMVNEAEELYAKACNDAVEAFWHNEELTETVRKVKINAQTASKKREMQDLKLLYRTLDTRIKSLFQAIKTRREER